MFGAVLRDFDAEVAQIHQAVVNAFDLVAKDEGNFWIFGEIHLVYHHAANSLLNGNDGVAVGFERIDGGNAVGTMLPLHRLLRAKGGLADFGVWRASGDATQ